MRQRERQMQQRPSGRPEAASPQRVRPTGDAAPPRHDVTEERMRPVKLAGRLFE